VHAVMSLRAPLGAGKQSSGYTTGAQLHRVSNQVKLLFTNINMYVRSELFTAMTIKNGVFWDLTPYGSSKNRSLGNHRAEHATPLYPQNLALNFVKWLSISR
jgi:hypothetical protein